MFRCFRREKTGFDLFVESIYGKNTPKISADVDASVDIAFDDLLNRKIKMYLILDKSRELYKSGIPYNAHNLAIAVAFFSI